MITPKSGSCFGYYTLISFVSRDNKRNQLWLCKCICGKEQTIRVDVVISGGKKSCGCKKKEYMKLGDGSRGGVYYKIEYQIWINMLRRCRDIKDIGYKYYGGRGITVCERWQKFENFYADMGPRPSLGRTLDRIDNNGNYEPTNCRWATMEAQAFTRRLGSLENHVRGSTNGKAKLTESNILEISSKLESGKSQKLLSEEYGVSNQTISSIKNRTTWKHVKI